jgi:hypothetical protein|tara:strand:+ start:337 stop:480 length:144 start_codon:yes stop_codon:yes gene_type:complete
MAIGVKQKVYILTDLMLDVKREYRTSGIEIFVVPSEVVCYLLFLSLY